jgi:hypothetical protein
MKMYGGENMDCSADPASITFWGEKLVLFSLIQCLQRHNSLIMALSYGLILDAVYDFYVMMQIEKVGGSRIAILPFFIIKVLGCALGLNSGFGLVSDAHIINFFTAFWGVIGILSTKGILQVFRFVNFLNLFATSINMNAPHFQTRMPPLHNKKMDFVFCNRGSKASRRR